MLDDLDPGTGPRHHVQGVRRFVKSQRVGLLHGWVTHLFDGNSGGQIVTNNNVRRGLGYPGQPARPGQAVRGLPHRVGLAQDQRGPLEQQPYTSSWPPRVSATSTRPSGSAARVVAPSPARNACWARPSAPIVVTEVCPRSSTTVVFPCVARASTRAKILLRLAAGGRRRRPASEARVYTAPSALPNTSLPSARRAIAVNSVLLGVGDWSPAPCGRPPDRPRSSRRGPRGRPCRCRRRSARSPAPAAATTRGATCAAPNTVTLAGAAGSVHGHRTANW